MCVAFTNIGNDYSFKIKKNTVNYASTTNQIIFLNSQSFFKKKFQRLIIPVAIENLLYCSPFRHTLSSGSGPGLGPSEKADPRPLKDWTLYQNSLYEFKDWFLTNSRVLISNRTIVFLKLPESNPKVLTQKYPNKTFFVQNSGNSVFRKILLLAKFEGANSKYNNIVFKFQHKNTQIRHI